MGGDSLEISITLKLLKYAQRQKAIEQGQRDTFHIKVRLREYKLTLFEAQVYAVIKFS
jgi:hypothetical protein